MKTKFFAILAAAITAVTCNAQTVKTLSYGTNYAVIGPTNTLTWSNAFAWSTNTAAAATRTNMGLPAGFLTNTNAVNFRNSLDLAWTALTNSNAATRLLGYTTNNTVIGPTNTNALVWTNKVSFSSDVTVQDWTVGSATIGWGGTTLLNGEEHEFFEVWNFASAPTFSSPAATLTNLGLYATNAKAVPFANALYDTTLTEQALAVVDADLSISASMVRTNAPTNTTNAARWIRTISGTNTYFVPLYQ